MNTQTKAQRINKRHDAIWEEWLGGNGKDTIIQSGDELAKVTAQRDKLLKACERARDHLIMDIDRSGAGILSHDSPEALKQCKAAINGSTFEGHEIPFNLHSKIRDLLSQRDELLAACKLALDKLETFQPEIKTPVTQKILRAAIAKAESNQT